MNMQIGKKKAWLLLGVLLGAIFLATPVINVEGADPTGLAYIYLDNSTAADSYKAFLDSNDYSVSLIPMQNVNITDFSIYDIIIIGLDTAVTSNLWQSNTSQIIASGKPILGLYTGGGYFIDALGGPGYLYSAFASVLTIGIDTPAHSIFTTPNTIPTTPTLTLSSVSILNLLNSSAPTGTHLYGYFLPSPNYYPIYEWTNGSIQILQFGFNAWPTNLTATGKSLLLNMVHYLLDVTPPIPGFQAMFMLCSLVLILAFMIGQRYFKRLKTPKTFIIS